MLWIEPISQNDHFVCLWMLRISYFFPALGKFKNGSQLGGKDLKVKATLGSQVKVSCIIGVNCQIKESRIYGAMVMCNP